MKKIAVVLLSCTLLSSSIFADEKVLATYKGGKVRESDIMTQFKQALDSTPELKNKTFKQFDKELQESLVRNFVDAKLVAMEAKSTGIAETKDFKDKLENVKMKILQNSLFETQLKNAITDSKIDEEYKKIAASLQGKSEAKVSAILVQTEDLAKEVKAKLASGSKFSDVAKKYSQDTSTGANGGELGYIVEGTILPTLDKKIFAMKAGEVSAPIKTEYGWHILKVEEKRKVKIPSKEDAKANIRSKLSEDVIKKYVESLEKKYDFKMSM